MSPEQLRLLALIIPTVLGGLYLAYVFSRTHHPTLFGAMGGAVSGFAGALLFSELIDYCTFTAESSSLEIYLGLFWATVGGVIVVGLAQFASATFVYNKEPVSLGGVHTPGMFKGWILPIVLLSPSLLILVMFLYYPALQTFRMSVFNTRLGSRGERFICVDNFARLLREDGFVLETLVIFALIIVGFVAVRWLSREDAIGRALQAGGVALVVAFMVLNISPTAIVIILVLSAVWLAGQDRDTWPMWLGYAVTFVLTVLLFQEVLYEVLSRSSVNNYYRIVSNTFVISGVIVVLSLTISLAIAYVAYQPIRGGYLYRTLLIWPYAISPPVAGIIFNLIFNPEAGLANYLLDSAGFARVAWKSAEYAPWTIVLASVWKSLGFSILFYIAGLQNIPKDLVEAAAIDGANVWQRFTRIVIPMLSPITFFLIITNITYAFFDIFGTIDYLTSGGPAGATTVMIYGVYDTFNSDYLGRAAAQSIILFILVVAITFMQFRTTGRNVTYGGA
jgi:sn-glycerol 3-phosphate transport system permease protein